MTVASLFAELDLKISGSTAGELKAFQTTLEGIAAAARNAALALKILARTKLPPGMGRAFSTPSASSGGAQQAYGPQQPPVNHFPPGVPQPGMLNFIGPTTPLVPNPPMLPAPAAGMLNFIGPIPQQGKPSTSVLQGLKMLGTLGAKILGFATVAIAIKKLASAVMEMIRASMQASYTSDKIAAQTGVTRGELTKWEHLGALGDMKEGEVGDTFRRLKQNAVTISWNGEGIVPYQQLGINPFGSPDVVLKRFFERTKHLSQAQASFFGNQMGISDDLIYSYRKNGDKLNSLGKGALSDKEQSDTLALASAWKEITFQVGILANKLTADLAPALTIFINLVDKALEFLNSSKGVRSFITDALAQGSGISALQVGASVMRGINQSSVTTHNHNDVDINVDGSGNPAATGRATAREFNKQVGNSSYTRPDPQQNR